MAQMTHRERIIATINHQPVDRIATDYWGVDEITADLMKHFNVNNMIDLSKAMDIDKIIEAKPKLIVPDRPNMLGLEMKQIPLPDGNGFYEEPVSHPLADCEDIEDVENSGYVFPSVDMFDYSVVEDICNQASDFAIDGGYISLTYFYELIRGTENMLVDFIANPELAEYILARLQEFAHENTKRILEAGQGRVTVSQVTDDLGSQDSLLMSPDMIDSYLGKYYDDNIKLVKSYGAKVFHHDDGAMTPMLPWLVDNKGIEILNPLQWHLPGWDLKAIKEQYGDRLCFHGGVDNQFVLPYGTMEDLYKEVNDCMDALYTDKTGYILGPCHNVQANTSVEKVLNMYKYAREYKG